MNEVIELFRELSASQFNLGYMTALLLILGLVVILMILRFCFWLLFRTRRCSLLTVEGKGGALQISADAVKDAVQRELLAFPQLKVHRVQLFSCGKVYLMTLYCTFSAIDGKGLPELTEILNTRLHEMLEGTFGLSAVRKINLRVEQFDAGYRPAPVPDAPQEGEAADPEEDPAKL